jgi:predicted ATPase
MIKNLKLTNVGPAPLIELEFGKRLNILTGDNGLGKSFLLDIIWWTLTKKWPADVNEKLATGKKALPIDTGDAAIDFSFMNDEQYTGVYIRKEQAWKYVSDYEPIPGVVLYAMSDGSFAIWDSYRNNQNSLVKAINDHVPAYVFSPTEVWDGLIGNNKNWICNGLIRDWASWQKEKGGVFDTLKDVLKVLSPSVREQLEPGNLVRISIDDVRDIPTIKMPYQQEVPVLHASSAIRRVIALAYFLVWSWEEHKQAAKQLGEPEAKQITFLVDEIESHLHPSWQRRIIPALLKVMQKLSKDVKVQLITATHSPLIMASVEPLFDEKQDAWFDFNLVKGKVKLEHYDFIKHGDAENWLLSEAFDLKSTRPVEYEKLTNEAYYLLKSSDPSKDQILKMNNRLVKALDPKDKFLFNWRYLCSKRGFLK